MLSQSKSICFNDYKYKIVCLPLVVMAVTLHELSVFYFISVLLCSHILSASLDTNITASQAPLDGELNFDRSLEIGRPLILRLATSK